MKMKKLLGSFLIASCLILPGIALAATDWGVGGGVDSNGNWSVDIGVGEGSGSGSYGSSSSSGWYIDSLSGFGLPEASIYDIFANFLYWLLSILGIAGVIGFALSGVMYLLAAGNEDMVGKAKKAMTASILGVIVGLSGLVIIRAVHWALNGFSFF